jgi:hypothetical protein
MHFIYMRRCVLIYKYANIQQDDGSVRSSPWYLRIGKYKVVREREREREIEGSLCMCMPEM